MSSEALLELFAELPLPSGAATAFVARQIDGTDLRLARGRTGAPALLLPTAVSGPGIRLSNLTFMPKIACDVSQEGGSKAKQEIGVLECVSDDPELHRYFLQLIVTFVEAYRAKDSEAEAIEAALRHIAELFRALQLPAKTTIQGLWCELFVLANAANKVAVCEAWHGVPRDLYDFAERDQRLEVKSSSTGTRAHRFSLEQLSPPPGLKVIVASFVLSPAGTGLSVFDLWRSIDAGLPMALRRHVEKQMTAALGSEWRNASRVAFDPDDAGKSMRFYRACDIPRVDRAVPIGVSEVRFVSDLKRVPAISATRVRAEGALFDAIAFERRGFRRL
jgi:hypothetical protein